MIKDLKIDDKPSVNHIKIHHNIDIGREDRFLLEKYNDMIIKDTDQI